MILRDRAGLAQIVGDAADAVDGLLAGDGARGRRRRVAAAQAPGGVELHEPAFEVLAEPAEPPPFELRRPELKEQLPTILDHAPVALRHPRERAMFALAAAAVAGFRAALDGLGFTEIQTPKIVGYRDRERRERLRGSTTSGGRRTWRRARSSTSRRWSACSSASSRSGRSSGPSRTTRAATSPSTSRSTPSSGSSATTLDVMAVAARRPSPGWSQRDRAGRRRARAAVELPAVPARSRCVHFARR